MTDIKQPIDTLADQIGRDMRLLIGRLSTLERTRQDSATTTPEALPTLPLPSLSPVLPITTGVDSDTDLGFVDLRLSPADWSQWDTHYDGADLLLDSSLQTAIIISVWTDARSGDEGGWWGDVYQDKPTAESLLWTLLGKPATPENVELGVGYVKKALQWLLDDQWLTACQVTGEAQRNAGGLQVFAFRVETTDKNGTRHTLYL